MQPKEPQIHSSRAIWLLAQFELIRQFKSKRGIISLLAFAIVWFFIIKVIVLQSVSVLNEQGSQGVASNILNYFNLNALLQWPSTELAVFWLFAMLIFPFVTIVMTSDQTASDVKRGTVRFLLLRTTRTQLLLGRFTGKLCFLTMLIITTILPVVLISIMKESSSLLPLLSLSLFVCSSLIIVCIPLMALMALLNSIYQSSKISMLFALILVPLISSVIKYAVNYFPPIESLLYLLPGIQIFDTLQLASYNFQIIVTPLLQTTAFLVLAKMQLARKSL